VYLIMYIEEDLVEYTVHQQTLDEAGNVHNAPPGYRRFLLDEEVRLVSRATG